MVGDRLYTDLRMANNAGITGILVLSGETKRDNIKNLSADQRYFDYVFENVAELKNKL
jgi:NagD protein